MISVLNPATGKLIKQCPSDNPELIKNKFQKAKQAQKEWAKVPLGTRMDCLVRFKKLIENEKQELARLLTHEVGKPIAQSKNELNGLTARIDFFLEQVANVSQAEEVARRESDAPGVRGGHSDTPSRARRPGGRAFGRRCG